MKPETSSSINQAYAALLFAVAALVLMASAGCKAMANPDGTDLPWTERPNWEFAPNVPQSMMQQ